MPLSVNLNVQGQNCMCALLTHNRNTYLALVVGEILRCPDFLWLVVSGGFMLIFYP